MNNLLSREISKAKNWVLSTNLKPLVRHNENKRQKGFLGKGHYQKEFWEDNYSHPDSRFFAENWNHDGRKNGNE